MCESVYLSTCCIVRTKVEILLPRWGQSAGPHDHKVQFEQYDLVLRMRVRNLITDRSIKVCVKEMIVIHRCLRQN